MNQYVRPTRSVAQEALIAVVRAADRVKREMSPIIERYGITIQQYNVLRQSGTERPYSSPLDKEKRAGTFANSIAKFHHVLRMCEQLDVCTQVGRLERFECLLFRLFFLPNIL